MNYFLQRSLVLLITCISPTLNMVVYTKFFIFTANCFSCAQENLEMNEEFDSQTKNNSYFAISLLPFPRFIFNLRQCLSDFNFLKMYASTHKFDVEPLRQDNYYESLQWEF